MTIDDVRDLLNATVIVGNPSLTQEVHTACGSDSLGDTMAYIKEKAVFLTGITDSQVVRTAEMMDIVCIVFVRGKQPDEATVKLAEELKIILLGTNYRMYEACGILYSGGLGRVDSEEEAK